MSDPHLHEPGGAAYGVRRLLSGVGLLGLASVVLVTTSSILMIPRSDPPAVGDIELMWGDPPPQMVERVFLTSSAPSPDLVGMPLLGYQQYEEGVVRPEYILRLTPFSYLGKPDVSGYIGQPPGEGFSAIGFADLVVNSRGPVLCVPRDVVVIETEDTVSIGVFYGLPNPKTEPVGDDEGAETESDDVLLIEEPPPAALDNATACPADAPLTASLLIPIDLSAPVGDRTVLALDGTELHQVPTPE